MSKRAQIIRQRGRPKSENPRNTTLLLNLTEEEAEQIAKKAEQAGKPKAAWIREVALAA